jgi:Lar family restriction alleviation protein
MKHTENQSASLSAGQGSPAPPLLGDDGQLTCLVCGKKELGLGWPTPRLCMECGHERDKVEPKACPFCGIQGAIWKLKDDDGENAEYFIRCAVCNAEGPKANLEGLAMMEWNRRKSPNADISRPASK